MERSNLEKIASGASAAGAGVIVYASGWFSLRMFEIINTNGMLSALGVLGMFIIISAIGIGITKSIDG